jgi:hypothetical protein
MKQGKFLFENWLQPPPFVYFKVYIFNVTNADEFLDGQNVSLKVQEVGPYVYQ